MGQWTDLGRDISAAIVFDECALGLEIFSAQKLFAGVVLSCTLHRTSAQLPLLLQYAKPALPLIFVVVTLSAY